MSVLTVRNLVEGLKTRLRVRVAQHGCSIEVEAREILRESLADEHGRELSRQIRRRFEGLGLDKLEIERRSELPRAPDLGS